MEKKRLKIAFFSLTQNFTQRGAETFVGELSKRLEKNYEVTIITQNKPLLKRWPFLWRLYIDPQGLQVLWFTIKNSPKVLKEKYNIVISLNGGWQVLLLRLATLLSGGKLIISGQSGKGWDDRVNLWSFPNCFIAISTRLMNWAKGVNPFVRVKYIPNGVDIDKFKPVGERINFNLEKPIILCVGALTHEKRVELAIKAVSKMQKGSLVVVGEGPLKEKLLNLGNKFLGTRFTLTSADFSEIQKYYRGADLFTLPSPWFRSFEIVIVEAMASNLPVVVNDDPIRVEIVGHGGLLVNPENEAEYVKALEKALSLNWGTEPRKQAEKFSWDIVAERYEELFLELAK